MLGEVGTASVVLLVVLVLLSAFFSGSEAALLSVQRVRMRHLVSTKAAGAARVSRMVESPNRLLPPILLGNNLVNTAVAALATSLTIVVLKSESQGVLIATALVTVTLLIFGETIPKILAVRNAERVAMVVALPIEWFGWVARPITFLLEGLSLGVTRVLGSGDAGRRPITEEEIKAIVSAGRDEGAVEHEEAEMIRRVLEFGDRHVREVMTPRPEIVWVELGTTIRQFLELYNEKYHTRFPVFQDRVDNVVGLVAVKDVMRLLSGGASLDDPVTSTVRTAFFVPETKRVQQLFDEMRRSGEQVAMIADEFGGVAGLVTLKRLVEDIVGRVGDEAEGVAEEYVEVDANTFELDAGMSISEANERLGLGLPAGEYETIAGFLLEHLGSVPQVHDFLVFADLRFSITEMRGVRIAKVRVVRTPAPDA